MLLSRFSRSSKKGSLTAKHGNASVKFKGGEVGAKECCSLLLLGSLSTDRRNSFQGLCFVLIQGLFVAAEGEQLMVQQATRTYAAHLLTSASDHPTEVSRCRVQSG